MELPGTLPDRREVHVRFVELEAGDAAVEACARSLSADEAERASRFGLVRLRTAFTLSRGILRVLLGGYLAIDARHLRFAYGPHGKPRLAFPDAPLGFNVSHSGKFAAYAFAVDCEAGVDIEKIRSMPNQESLVRRFFSPRECEEWLALEAGRRNEGFFRIWTRKEAYLKAVGVGLLEDPGAGADWHVRSLEPPEGYSCALAVADGAREVRIMPRLTAEEALETHVNEARAAAPPWQAETCPTTV